MIDMDSKITRLIEQASVIVGALPYLQAYRDKTFLIKFGGSAMDDARLVKKLMRDIVLLEVLGFNPVIVHGGGKAISKAMAEAGWRPASSTVCASRRRKPFHRERTLSGTSIRPRPDVPRLRRQGRRHSRHGNLRGGTHPGEGRTGQPRGHRGSRQRHRLPDRPPSRKRWNSRSPPSSPPWRKSWAPTSRST